MFKTVIKKTDNYIEGIGFLEEIFEKISDKQNEKLIFEVEETNKNNKIDITIKINTVNGKRKRK